MAICSLRANQSLNKVPSGAKKPRSVIVPAAMVVPSNPLPPQIASHTEMRPSQEGARIQISALNARQAPSRAISLVLN